MGSPKSVSFLESSVNTRNNKSLQNLNFKSAVETPNVLDIWEDALEARDCALDPPSLILLISKLKALIARNEFLAGSGMYCARM